MSALNFKCLYKYAMFLLAVFNLNHYRYATASARSDGMLLLCGGRDASGMVDSSAFVTA